MDTLAAAIADWDARKTTPMLRAYAAHHQRHGFIERLIDLTASRTHQTGATWLIKHAIDEKDLVPEALEPCLAQRFCDHLPTLEHWGAQLHALQLLCVLTPPDPALDGCERFARACIGSSQKFVRAWACSALHAVAMRKPSIRDDVESMLMSIMQDPSEPASVRARLRNTLKAR